MRNLILLLSRTQAFILFILLESVCFYLIIQNNHIHRSTFVNSANEISGRFYQKTNNLRSYFRLKRLNDSLLTENQQLQTKLHKLLFVEDNRVPAINTSKLDSNYIFIATRVINNSTYKVSNYLTLNRGKNDGLDDKMGVVSAQGVVGIIRNVSANFASVISILHKEINISAKIQDSNYRGFIVWNKKDHTKVQLNDIPFHVNVKIGDKVVTTGYSSYFPENVLIGAISDYKVEEGTGLYSIEVSLATNMKTLQYVYAIQYMQKEEKLELEERINEN